MSNDKKKPNVIFVLGGPGAGKGTQCERIANTYNYVHLSTGDILRDECKKGSNSKFGKIINEHIKNGELVPEEIIITLLEEAMAKSVTNNFLIDGFPRNKDNVDDWNKDMGDGKVNLQCVLFFDCNEEITIQRCLERGKSSGRSDDNAESLKKRIRTYNESTRPIIDMYTKQNLVKTINASRDVETVFKDVQKLFDEFRQQR